MGSKKRISKEIIQVILEKTKGKDIKNWIEPFVGGANLIEQVPPIFNRYGYDANPHTIMALRTIRDYAEQIPEEFTEEEYKQSLGTEPDKFTSLFRFTCSFGSKFEGGYAKGQVRGKKQEYVKYCKNSALRQQPLLQGVHFEVSDYQNILLPPNPSIIYCDPPYSNTTGYKTGKFNHDEFFAWCIEQKGKGHYVFVSEYQAPFEEIWQGKRKIVLNRNTTNRLISVEKLFLV